MEKEPKKDTRPDWIKANATGVGGVNYLGRKIPFTIIKKELAPTLPGFLGYFNGEHLFISEEVPEEYRMPQLVHEIIEFTELKDKKGRCLEALKRELSIVPEEIKQSYLEYRKKFFAKLIEYYKDSQDEDFKAEIAASYEFLQSLS